MAQTLFRDLQNREGIQQRIAGDAYVFEERNPLDETLLRDIETELVAITGCSKKDRARITVLELDDFQRAVKRIVPKRLIDSGLANHFRVIQNPSDPHHILVGPSALAGLNAGHSNVITDLVYQLISASGHHSNQAFDHGAADLIAEELARRLGLDLFTNQHPEERHFAEAVIGAIKNTDDDMIELVGLLKRNPKQFFNLLKESKFYHWWEGSAQQNDKLSGYVDLINSITAPNAQLEGSFMSWAKDCAQTYRDFRQQQQRNALAGVAKRAEPNK